MTHLLVHRLIAQGEGDGGSVDRRHLSEAEAAGCFGRAGFGLFGCCFCCGGCGRGAPLSGAACKAAGHKDGSRKDRRDRFHIMFHPESLLS